MLYRVALALICLSSVASADVFLSPGDNVFITSHQRVTCGGGRPASSTVRLCDCMTRNSYGNPVLSGQAFATSGSEIAAMCRSIESSAAVDKCVIVDLIEPKVMTCDCMSRNSYGNLVKNGTAFGTSGTDVTAQCKASNASAPFNCQIQ